jgi:5-(carboxyamino)imidazole ribonucleotide synthase
VDVLTFEFENIPVQSVDWAAEHCVVRPSGKVLHACQHRLREKEFLRSAGLPLAEFEAVDSLDNASRSRGATRCACGA